MTQQLTLEHVRGEGLVSLWPRLQSELEKHEDLWLVAETPESIWAQLVAGALQLWVFLDKSRSITMSLMTHIEQREDDRVMKIVWAVGVDARSAALTIESFERAALSLGCSRLEIWGRAGWARLLRDFGYREMARVVGRDLDGLSERLH